MPTIRRELRAGLPAAGVRGLPVELALDLIRLSCRTSFLRGLQSLSTRSMILCRMFPAVVYGRMVT